MNDLLAAPTTRTQMQELSALAAERGDRFDSVYWSSRSYGDVHAEAWAAAKAATTQDSE